MSLARVASSQSRAVIVLVVLLCAAGLYAAFQLPVAIFPQTNFPRIVIVIDNGVVPAPQMLASVTRPVEEAMNGVPGIVRISSTTQRGAADINLFFDWSVDIVQSLQLVQARLSQLASSLPTTAEKNVAPSASITTNPSDSSCRRLNGGMRGATTNERARNWACPPDTALCFR